MKTRTWLGIVTILLLAAACTTLPQAAAPAMQAPASGDWQTYAHPDGGFSIGYPPGWTVADLPPTETTQGVALDGAEGRVELQWGTGFGGACPAGYSTVKVAQGELPACHTVAADGTQHWEQINKALPATSFSGRAYTQDAAQASADAVLAVLATLTFQEAAAAPIATTAQPGPVNLAKMPLKDALADEAASAVLLPRPVWQNFYDITQAPRPSHHEEQIRAWLVDWGQGHGFETTVDDTGNVLMRKPAAAGMEDRAGVVLQGHMDMVAQQDPGVTFDPLTDPINAYVEGEWTRAEGTTLGADNGIGMAIALAILQEQTPLGPLEALFTINEEDGLEGALGLQPGVLQGQILINLDSETVGEFTIGSAGGEYASVAGEYAQVAAPPDMLAYQLSVGGLTGGHSGVDIDKGRGHALKLLARLLTGADPALGVRVAQLGGGTAANAIPREAAALVVVPATQADAFLAYVSAYQDTIKNELAAVEPDVSARAEPADLPAQVMDAEAQRRIIEALDANPQGVIRMSDAVPGLVETSTNMGIVNAADGQLAVTILSRSSLDSAIRAVGQTIASVWDLAGYKAAFSGGYSGWAPNPESPILLLMKDTYTQLYNEEPVVGAIHAGLECGTISSKYPGMDAISVGPTMSDVHTPSERLHIASVKKFYDFLLETLKQVPSK
jgi:dipeptidase D